MADEQILARRITLDEFVNYMGKLEYIRGRMVTGRGIELFVGVKEFPESIRALEEEKRRMLEDGAAGTNETRCAAATRVYMEQEIESAVRQLWIEGSTVEDCEAELHFLADFVRAKADSLRAAWPELMKDTVWELDQQGRSVGDVINERLAGERKPDHSDTEIKRR